MVLKYLRTAWAALFELPWRHAKDGDEFELAARRGLQTYPATNKWASFTPERVASALRWLVWLVGWLWILAGLLLGAFLAPAIMEPIGVAQSPYRSYIGIAIAILVAFFVQLVAWLLMLLSDWSARGIQGPLRFRWSLFFAPAGFALMLWPLVIVGVILYLYLTGMGHGQRTLVLTFVESLLIKQVLIPVIVGIVRGRAFKVGRAWLRGGRLLSK